MLNFIKLMLAILGIGSSLQAAESENSLTDKSLPPYPQHSLIGQNVWLRPVFSQDGESIKSIFTDPEAMKHYATGRTYTPEEIEISTRDKAHKNREISSKLLTLEEGSYATSFAWTFFNHKGASGRVYVWPAAEGRWAIAYVGQGGEQPMLCS